MLHGDACALAQLVDEVRVSYRILGGGGRSLWGTHETTVLSMRLYKFLRFMGEGKLRPGGRGGEFQGPPPSV